MAKRKQLAKSTKKKLREQLLEERAELSSQVEGLEREADITQWRDAGFDDDPADTGSAAFERERAQSLATHAKRTLLLIDDALQRMEGDDYGTCVRCEEPIPVARLEALPHTTMCADCKRLDEHGR